MNLLEIRILGACGAVFILLLAYGAWHHKVYEEGYQDRIAYEQKAYEEGKKKYEKKSSEVHHLPDADLRKRYCKWVRDDINTCLKGPSPFIP